MNRKPASKKRQSTPTAGECRTTAARILPGDPDVLTAEGVAGLLGTTRRVVIQMARRHVLPGRKVGRQWRFSQTQIREWLKTAGTAMDKSSLVAQRKTSKPKSTGGRGEHDWTNRTANLELIGVKDEDGNRKVPDRGERGSK